jgi:uncharacterized membrane protein YkvA (DUF1232 family)
MFDPNRPETLSAARWYSAPRLWRTLLKAAKVAGGKALLTALTLFFCLRDHDTPRWARRVIVGALGYFVLPTDLVPDALPMVGFGDDLVALTAALATVAAYVKDEHKRRATEQVVRLFGKGDPAPPEEFIE